MTLIAIITLEKNKNVLYKYVELRRRFPFLYGEDDILDVLFLWAYFQRTKKNLSISSSVWDVLFDFIREVIALNWLK